MIIKPKQDLSTAILNEITLKLPKILKDHKKLYKTYDESSSFCYAKKGLEGRTEFDSTEILYFFDGLTWSINTDVNDGEYYFWNPVENEFYLSSVNTSFLLHHDDYLMGEYNFSSKSFYIEETDQQFEVQCIDSLREMIFTLSLERANIIECELLWSMLSPMIELRKKIPKDIEYSVQYCHDYQNKITALDIVIPKMG